jgi:hypothetical protein
VFGLLSATTTANSLAIAFPPFLLYKKSRGVENNPKLKGRQDSAEQPLVRENDEEVQFLPRPPWQTAKQG